MTTSTVSGSPERATGEGSRLERLETKFAVIVEKYNSVRTALRQLVVLDEELQQQIEYAHTEMRDIKGQFTDNNTIRLQYTRTPNEDPDPSLESAADLLEQRLDALKASLIDIRQRITDTILFDESSPLVRVKTQEELQQEELESQHANNRWAKEFGKMPVGELETHLQSFLERKDELQFSGAWMAALFPLLGSLERDITKRIGIYRFCLKPASEYALYRTGPHAAERRQDLLNDIAGKVYTYSTRLEWLEQLDKEMHRITNRVFTAQDVRFTVASSKEEIPGLALDISRLLKEAAQSHEKLQKERNARSLVESIIDHIEKELPKSVRGLIDLTTILILKNALTQGSAIQLKPKDISTLVKFFHPDPYTSKIEALTEDPEKRKNLKDTIATMFKLAKEIQDSAFS